MRHPRSLLRCALSSARRCAAPLFGPSSEGAPTRDAEVSAKFSRGVKWNTTAKMSTRAIQFLVTIVLARLLAPADFGLAEMAAMVTMLAGMVAEFGFAHALVQRDDITDTDIRTAMTLSVLFAVVLAALGVAAAGLVASLFHAPELRMPLSVACAGIVVAAVGITPRALLIKSFDFRSIAVADFAGCIVYGVTGVSLALAGARVWSIVLAVLAMIACQTLVLAVRSRCSLRPLIDMDSARVLVPFGARMFGANFLDYLRGNIDYYVIGATLGAAPLGIYTIAFRIADFPRSRLVTSVTEVAFSAMSSVHKEMDNLRRAYVRALAMASLFAFPLLLGFTALAEEFVSAVYGPKWMAAVAPLRILLPMALLLIVSQQSAIVLVAMGEPGRYLRLGASYAAAVGVFAAIGVRWGIAGAALGVLAATILYSVASAVLIFRRVGITPLVTLRAVAAPGLSCAVMVVALQAYRAAVPFPAETAPGLLWLAAGGVIGAAVYVTAALAAGAMIGKRAERARAAWRRDGEGVVGQIG